MWQLRKADFGAALQQLREAVELEPGPELKRPSSQIWVNWVHAVPGRRVRGTSAVRKLSQSTESPRGGSSGELSQGAAPTSIDAVTAAVESVIDAGGGVNRYDVLPLHLLDLSDVEYLEMIFGMLHRGSQVVRYYLHSIVLPDNTAHQASKLSANGQDLGGHMIFSRCVEPNGLTG